VLRCDEGRGGRGGSNSRGGGRDTPNTTGLEVGGDTAKLVGTRVVVNAVPAAQ